MPQLHNSGYVSGVQTMTIVTPRRGLGVSTATALILAVSAQPSFSQGNAPDGAFQLEEVVVTARKKVERLEDVPTAIAVFSGEALDRMHVVSLDELAKHTTGLTFDTDFGRFEDRPILRGQANILGNSGVSYFIDGVYYTGSLLDFNLDDVASLEVIKGPQSALHGRNSYSGAITIATRAPTDEFSGTAKVEYAQFGQGKVSGSISGPLVGDVFGASLSASYYERDGVSGQLWRNQFNGEKMGDQQSKTANFGTYWTPTENLDVRTRVYWSEQNDGHPSLFLQGYQANNVYPDNGNLRPNVNGAQGFPVATGGGSVYLGSNRYYRGEIQPRQISIDYDRSIGVSPEIADRRLLAALIVNYKITDSLTGTYVGGYNRSRSRSIYDFDYQATSFGPFMTSSVGLRPRAGSPVGTYEYAVSTGAPAANFSSVGRGEGEDQSHELRLRWQKDAWDVLLGGYFFKAESDSFSKQTPVAGWGTQLAQSLGVLQARMQAACSTFFQNRAGFANCTSVVRRTSAATATILPFDATTGLWTTFDDSDSHSQLENTAFFGAVTFKATDRLELGAEVRSARETVERLPGNLRSLAYLTDLTPNTPFNSVSTIPYQKATFDSVTPRVTARFDLTERNHLYAVYAEGNKPGGINDIRAQAIGYGSFDEEDAQSFEIGTKNVFLDGRLTLNAAAFRNTIDGYQLTDSVVYLDGTPSTVTKNVGEVRITGVEFEADYAPSSLEGLVLRLNYSYTDAKVEKGLDANEGVLADVGDDGQLNCSRGLAPDYATLVASIRAANPNITPATVICHNGTGTQYFGAYGSIAGRKLPRVPAHNLNVGFDYTRPLAGDWTFTGGVSASYESKKYVQVDNLAYYGEATILNASIGFSNETYTVSLWAKNLGDEDSVVAASRFTDATNQSLRGFFGMNRLPRQFGLSAAVKF